MKPIFLRGPAVTRRAVGAGQVIYVGAYLLESAIEVVCRYLMTSLALPPIAQASGDVEMIARVGGDVRYVVLLNHGRTAQKVSDIQGHDLLADAIIDGETALEPFAVAIFQSA